MDDGSVVIGRRTLPPIGMTPIGCLTDRIPITLMPRFGIIRIVHFMEDIIMDTVRRIIVTMGVIIPIETSIGGITVEVDMCHFHSGLTKKAVYGLKIGVRGVHEA